ncbi:tetratricopeptide repeat protein [Ruegeria hyattellae]|uniref:tetratricopeptide repeat protein n=1 Tax=Ruegeria hyattellae TaxID=3233337 RepID=UPI00355BFAAC
MRRLAACLLPYLTATSLAAAETCPVAPDHSASLDALILEVQRAPTEAQARLISNQMWELWSDAPNEQSQAILDRGMTRRSAWDLHGALEDFNRLVEYCPDYAEGYNQRAFVNFLRHDFAEALVDLDRALTLSPRHVAAMSGKALSLMALGRTDEASLVLDQALELNPWLPERNLAIPGGPLERKGQDI